MKERKLIFISCIGLIILCALFLTLLAFAGAFNRSINVPISYPQNTNNIIDVGKGEGEKEFNFAVITDKDTIELRNQANETLIIQLENRNWKDLQWSPNNRHLSVLGESEKDIYDLYLYSFLTKNWQRITNYSETGSGVTSYLWMSNEDIYLKQGESGESWVHTLNINSLSNGIIKVVKKEGELYKASRDADIFVLKQDAQFSILNLIGDEINNLLYIQVVNEEGISTTEIIKELYFMSDNETIIYVTASGMIAKGIRDHISAVNLENLNMNILCTRGSNFIHGFKIEENTLIILEGDIQRDSIVEDKYNLRVPFKVNTDNSTCYNSDNILFSITTDKSIWVLYERGTATEITYMDGVSEVSVKNK